jgi:hypothetical protein
MSTFSPNQPIPSPDASASTAVVVLSPEQTRAAWVELRDDQGSVVGFLARHGSTSHFFSPEDMEIIRQRAQTPPVGGKTTAEIFEAVRTRMQG